MLIVAIMLRIFLPKKGACLSSKLTARADRQFKFHKSGQLFIRTHNETLTVAVCLNLESNDAARESEPFVFSQMRSPPCGLKPCSSAPKLVYQEQRRQTNL